PHCHPCREQHPTTAQRAGDLRALSSNRPATAAVAIAPTQISYRALSRKLAEGSAHRDKLRQGNLDRAFVIWRYLKDARGQRCRVDGCAGRLLKNTQHFALHDAVTAAHPNLR